MNNDVKVSILTPVYNCENFIEETILSVLNCETSVKFEYIVVDDGSTDRSSRIIEKFANEITSLKQNNKGEASAVNTGLGHASGTYVLVVNADDPLLSGRLLDLAVQAMDNDSKIVACYPDWQIIDNVGKPQRYVQVAEYSEKLLIGRCQSLPGPGAIFRRHDAISIGGRDESFRFVGDYDFWLRLSRLGSFERIPEVLAQWRSHDASTSISNRNLQMAQERIRVMRSFLANNEISQQLKRNALSNSYYLAARLAFFDQNVPGKRFLFRSFGLKRGWPQLAKIHVVFFILLLPVSRRIVKLIPQSIVFKMGG